MITKEYWINGPVNIIRLEGTIDKNKKVVYIFGDYHYPLGTQTECPQYKSMDIDKLLANIFEQEKDREFDLFIEEYKFIQSSQPLKQTLKYIEKIWNFSAKNYTVDINKMIKTSEQFPNTRFHYFDIRESIDYFKNLFHNFDSLTASFGQHGNERGKAYLYDLYNSLKILHDNLIKPTIDKYNFITKMKERYAHKSVKIKMNIIIKQLIKNLNDLLTSIKTSYNKIDELYKKFVKNQYKEDIDDELHYPLYKIFNKIHDDFAELTSKLTDIYLLRRLLDKDYVKTGLIYTGNWHSYDITELLVKMFDFKITNVYQSNYDVNELNKKIKATKDIFPNMTYYDSLFFKVNPRLEVPLQCSNMFSFPDNLS